MDPQERLTAIRAQMDNAKESHQAVAAEALTSLSGFAPPMLLALGTRLAVLCDGIEDGMAEMLALSSEPASPKAKKSRR